MSQVPFTKEDNKTLVTDPVLVLSKYYPDIKLICEKKNIPLNIFQSMCPWWGNTYWSIDKAKKILGYNPKYNFKEFLQALSKDDFNYYPYANLPTWGVKS
jgi:UDP-glucose 4-epimerase